MIVLNITVSKVNYTFFLKDFLAIRTEFLILVCDLAIVSFFAIMIDFIIYLLFRRSKFIIGLLKSVFILSGISMFAADLFTLYYYNMSFNDIMFETITNTNARECVEFIQAYIVNPKLWLFFAVIIIIAYLLHRFISRRKILSTFIIISLFIMGIFASSREIFTGRGTPRLINSVSLSRIVIFVLHHYEGIKELQKMTQEAPRIELTKNNSVIPYVIFVLGESTTRNHMSIYNYNIQTNPKLSGRKLYIFDDTISPTPSTARSMERIFTFCNNESFSDWFKYADIFSILKEAGYYTVWLSNQESASFGTSVFGFYPNKCDYSEFIESLKEDMYRGSAYDESLLPVLDNALNLHHNKNFYVIHLMGTHFHYQKRYPENFSVFSLHDEDKGTESQKEIRARYDNAVLYNDYIVDEIIRRFEDKNAIVIYISDHGEEVYDEADFFGHLESVTRSMAEIPFIIWVSQKFSQAYPKLEQRIASSTHRPYMTDDMIHTLLDIMSIETSEYDPSRSIISASFDQTRPRIFYSKYIYDRDTGLHALQ